MDSMALPKAGAESKAKITRVRRRSKYPTLGCSCSTSESASRRSARPIFPGVCDLNHALIFCFVRLDLGQLTDHLAEPKTLVVVMPLPLHPTAAGRPCWHALFGRLKRRRRFGLELLGVSLFVLIDGSGSDVACPTRPVELTGRSAAGLISLGLELLGLGKLGLIEGITLGALVSTVPISVSLRVFCSLFRVLICGAYFASICSFLVRYAAFWSYLARAVTWSLKAARY